MVSNTCVCVCCRDVVISSETLGMTPKHMLPSVPEAAHKSKHTLSQATHSHQLTATTDTHKLTHTISILIKLALDKEVQQWLACNGEQKKNILK